MFGYELTDTITVFAFEEVYIMASKKKIDFLKLVESIKEPYCPPVKLIMREKVSTEFMYFHQNVLKLKYFIILFTRIK